MKNDIKIYCFEDSTFTIREAKMSFSDHLQKYDMAKMIGHHSNAVRHFVQMFNTAQTFDDWRNFYLRTILPEDRDLALCKMVDRAHTFGQWLTIFHETASDCEFGKIALDKMVKFADNPQDSSVKDKKNVRLPRWIKILKISPPNSVLEKYAEQRIIALLKEEKEKKTPLAGGL